MNRLISAVLGKLLRWTDGDQPPPQSHERPALSPTDAEHVVDRLIDMGYRRVVEANKGSVAAAKEAVRFELCRAGFEVVNDEDDVSSGLKTVVIMLADGRYVQHDGRGDWHVHRYPARG